MSEEEKSRIINPITMGRLLSAYRVKVERETLLDEAKEVLAEAKQKHDSVESGILKALKEIDEQEGDATDKQKSGLLTLERRKRTTQAALDSADRDKRSAADKLKKAEAVIWDLLSAAEEGDDLFDHAAKEKGLESYEAIPLVELMPGNELVEALANTQQVKTIADWFHFIREKDGINVMKGSQITDDEIAAIRTRIERFVEAAEVTEGGLFKGDAVPKSSGKGASKPTTKKKTTKKKRSKKKTSRKTAAAAE